MGIYTIEGRQIFIGGLPDVIDGQTVRIPIIIMPKCLSFSDTVPSYIYTKYPGLYLNARALSELRSMRSARSKRRPITMADDGRGDLKAQRPASLFARVGLASRAHTHEVLWMTGLSATGESDVLAPLIANAYVALHVADPGPTGASEVTGGYLFASGADCF